MVSLNHPAQGSTNWFTAVDNNWTTLEGGLNSGSGLKSAITAAKVVSGKADFFSLPSGLTLRLLASATDPFTVSFGGSVLTVTANVDLTLTDNAHNFVWIDNTGTTGSSAFPCVYSFTAPGSPATDQHWYDLGHDQMLQWNGSTWISVSRVFIGYARADSAAIASRYACEPLDLTPIQRYSILGTGSDGFLDLSAGTTTIDGLKQYSAIVLRGTATLVHTTAATTQMELISQGIAIMLGTANINLTGLGLPGGPNGVTAAGVPGKGGGFGGAGAGGGGVATAVNVGGGRITLNSASPDGGGAAGNPGGTGAASIFLSTLPKRQVYFGYGNGGGSGNGANPNNAGVGGAGGGSITITAACIALATGTTIHVDGGGGGTGFAPQTGGGGGGGGTAQLISRTLFNSGTFTAAGGGGGGGAGGSAPGGTGGAGALVTISF